MSGHKRSAHATVPAGTSIASLYRFCDWLYHRAAAGAALCHHCFNRIHYRASDSQIHFRLLGSGHSLPPERVLSTTWAAHFAAMVWSF